MDTTNIKVNIYKTWTRQLNMPAIPANPPDKPRQKITIYLLTPENFAALGACPINLI